MLFIILFIGGCVYLVAECIRMKIEISKLRRELKILTYVNTLIKSCEEGIDGRWD